MNRADYLGNDDVAEFVDFVAALIKGAPFHHAYHCHDRRLPPGYETRFGRRFSVCCIEEAFDRYFWASGDFNENQVALNSIRGEVLAAIRAEQTPDGVASALNAIKKVMYWGAGGNSKASLYARNVDWAESKGRMLPDLLREGRECIENDTPDLSRFAADGARMNAGYTKYFALACRESIIYDGRVGAALGLMVRRFCETTKRANVPGLLEFGWCPQNHRKDTPSAGRRRDPSLNGYRFPQLTPSQPQKWAKLNIAANWILIEAAKDARSSWCSGPDYVRRLEAALFMIGYDLPNCSEGRHPH